MTSSLLRSFTGGAGRSPLASQTQTSSIHADAAGRRRKSQETFEYSTSFAANRKRGRNERARVDRNSGAEPLRGVCGSTILHSAENEPTANCYDEYNVHTTRFAQSTSTSIAGLNASSGDVARYSGPVSRRSVDRFAITATARLYIRQRRKEEKECPAAEIPETKKGKKIKGGKGRFVRGTMQITRCYVKSHANGTTNAVSHSRVGAADVATFGIKALDFANLSAAVTKEARRDERGRTRKEIGPRRAARL